jgi:hypothetical protein
VILSLLLSLFLCGCPPLHGEDDTVVAAATRQKTGQGVQHQQVRLDQQMSSMFFQGVSNPKLARQKFVDKLLLEVFAVDEVCGLTEQQRLKCETAARLDVARLMEDVDVVLRRYAGRTIDLNSPADQPEWQRFAQDATAVQAKLAGAGDATSLLKRVIPGVLDDAQRPAWERETALRLQYQWQSVVESGLTQLNLARGLTAEQHDAIRGMLMEQPLRINAGMVWGQHSHEHSYICKYALSRLDRSRLDALVSKPQQKMLGECIEEGRRMAEWLKEQKLILE